MSTRKHLTRLPKDYGFFLTATTTVPPVMDKEPPALSGNPFSAVPLPRPPAGYVPVPNYQYAWRGNGWLATVLDGASH